MFAKSTSLFYHVAKKEIKKKEIPVDPVGKEVVEKGAVEEVEDMSLSNENAVAEAESFGEVELEEFKEDPDSDSHGDSNPEEDAVGELSSTAEVSFNCAACMRGLFFQYLVTGALGCIL